jgi:hypothetical protein
MMRKDRGEDKEGDILVNRICVMREGKEREGGRDDRRRRGLEGEEEGSRRR